MVYLCLLSNLPWLGYEIPEQNSSFTFSKCPPSPKSENEKEKKKANLQFISSYMHEHTSKSASNNHSVSVSSLASVFPDKVTSSYLLCFCLACFMFILRSISSAASLNYYPTRCFQQLMSYCDPSMALYEIFRTNNK